MRQAMLVLAVAIGSPLAMAQSTTGTTTPTPQHGPAVAASANPTRKPLSPIGRALADLLGASNQQRAQPNADAKAVIDTGAAGRTRLVAETEHGSVP